MEICSYHLLPEISRNHDELSRETPSRFGADIMLQQNRVFRRFRGLMGFRIRIEETLHKSHKNENGTLLDKEC